VALIRPLIFDLGTLVAMNQPTRQIDAHLQNGKRLHGAGRLGDAGAIYQQVLTVAPGHPDAMHMMGVLLLQTGQPGQGLNWIDRAIAAPGTPKGVASDFHTHRAHALLALGRTTEAIAACQVALQLRRGNAEAFQAFGHALTDAGDYQGALKAYHDASRLKPDLPDVMNNLGTALHHANRLEDAARTLARAHAKQPGDPGILLNLSSVLRDLGQFREAETRLLAAARLAPDDPRVRYDHALLMLLLGRFEAAWPGWEARFAAGAVADRGLAAPRWRGEPLAGRTLLIHAEQGLGDTIQFCRFRFPGDGKVLFESQPRIARLMRQRTDATVLRVGDPLPPFDLACPLMSLPAIFRTTEATIPRDVPYLSAEPDAVTRWRDRLGSHGFRVGIAWQGNPARREDAGRSIPLDQFQTLAAIPGVRLISLQKDQGSEQLTSGMAVETLGSDFDSGPDGFIDTAAVMMNLDLVISSDTAIPHLAGALGLPVWVALRAVPDWRFMLERPDSPWYPTMRLFRQRQRDQWTPVFAAIGRALAAEVSARG
jgi:Flp pilus assembly protein TadD